MKISVCWIVKNEENNLPRSLESVKAIADELIVVDTGSQDKTMDIARSFGARVEPFAWTGDFAAARNYALSLASFDLIIFLDADEFFFPALQEADRQNLESIFANPAIEALMIKRTDIDPNNGNVITTGVNQRIFRNHSQLFYQSPIHESLKKKLASGKWDSPATAITQKLNINHTGYQPDLLQEKAGRNLEILKEALASTQDPFDSFIYHSYLMREYKVAGDYEKAFFHLKYMLDHPEEVEPACRFYKTGFLQRVYYALDLGLLHRRQISRKQLWDTFIPVVRRLHPEEEGKTIDLYYQALFDLQPQRFLQEYEALSGQIPDLTADMDGQYRRSLFVILQHAADIYWLEGKKELAFELLLKFLTQSTFYNQHSFTILMDCLRGQPLDQVISFLQQLFDFSRPELYEHLLPALKTDHWRQLFLYVQKKQLDQGKLSKTEFLYLLLLNKKYEQLSTLALSIETPELQAEINYQLFLAAVCSDDRPFYEKYRRQLEEYAHILDAYFSGGALEGLTVRDTTVFQQCYHDIAFAAGLPIANKLAQVFSVHRLVCYVTKARNHLSNYRYEDLLREDTAGLPEQDFISSSLLCESLIRFSRFDEALALLKPFLDQELYDNKLFQLLFVISRLAPAGIAAAARQLYDQFLPVANEIADLQDICTTGYLPKSKGNKAERFYQKLKPAVFEQLLQEEAKAKLTPELRQQLSQAAPVLAAGGSLVEAIQARLRLAAHDQADEENWAALCSLLEQLGNSSLAKAIARN